MEKIPEIDKKEEVFEFDNGLGEAVSLRNLSPEEANDILCRTEVHSGEVPMDASNLMGNNLAPETILSGGTEPKFAFSKPFDIDGGRIAVIGYCEESPGSFVARSFYLSNSQGVFKYLPAYRAEDDKIRHFWKGLGEQSITLSYPIQRSLSLISSTGDKANLSGDPMKVFVSTAREMRGLAHSSTYAGKMPKVGDEILNEKPPRFEWLAPEKVNISENKRPNFDNKIGDWTQENSLYGTINLESFISNDDSLIYTFANDLSGRCWVANVEHRGPTNSMGIHSSRIYTENLTTPAYEYTGHDSGYGNDEKVRGNYVDVYDNYLSKIGVIKDYSDRIRNRETREFQAQAA